MKFCCLSYNFKSVDPLVKERYVFTNPVKVEALYVAIKASLGLNDLLILATCNRTEFYFNREAVDIDSLKFLLSQYLSTDFSESLLVQEEFTVEQEALKHLFFVASGGKSQVLGDCQVIHQLKEAYKLSNQLNNLSGDFHHLIHQVFKLNKRITNETNFKKGQTSVASSSVNLMARLVKAKKSTPILLVGMGQNGRDTLKNLLQAGYKNITICNRTIEKVKNLAATYHVNYASLDQLGSLIQNHSVIFVSVSLDSILINKTTFDWQKVSYHPKYFLDLCAIPSVDIAIEENPCHEVYDLSFMTEQNEETLRNRKVELLAVSSIIDQELKDYFTQKVIKSASNSYLKLMDQGSSIATCDFLSDFLNKNTDGQFCDRSNLTQMIARMNDIVANYHK